MQFASIASGSDYMARARQGMPEYGRPASADWAYARLVADTVARGGRGVVVMTNGALANGSDARIRRYFLDHGLVEAVIALPAHILGKSDVSLVVLGHDAGPVRMVDASDLGHEGRRQSTLDEKAIACVIDRLSRDGDHSKLVDSCVLGDARYVLDPRRFLGEILDDAVPFSSIVVSIGRGAALSAADLDTLSAEPDTHVRYLMASNIMGGLVAEDLPCLKVDDLKLDRYRLVDGDLVISKLGLPFKVAVAEVPAGETVLAVGNVFVVRLDPAKADPYFVAAYLSGHVGQNLLSRVSSGTNVPMLPISALRTLPVPDRPMDEQRGLGKRYRKAVEDARDLRATAERALEDALSLFDGKE
jgi:type I restriction enzyme M protein